MKITDDNWQLTADSVEHKQELFDYAESKGVPICNGGYISYRDDDDLTLGWWQDEQYGESGLMSHQSTPLLDGITEAEFIAMCDAYAAEAK